MLEMEHKHSCINIKLFLFEVTHHQFLPCPQSWTFEELLRVSLVLGGEFFSFSMWIFFSYSHFSWILTLCRKVALRKQTCLSSTDLSSPWHQGHHWGLVLCKAVDQRSALQMSWLQWEEGAFGHLFGHLCHHSFLPSSWWEVRFYLNIVFSTVEAEQWCKDYWKAILTYGAQAVEKHGSRYQQKNISLLISIFNSKVSSLYLSFDLLQVCLCWS